MVMEFCPYDLSGLVRQRVKFGLSHIKCLALQMFTGMAYLHASGFLHRDIKGLCGLSSLQRLNFASIAAANMLVGSDGVLKITDYGLARVVDQLESNPLTPNVCTVCGTLSPEMRGFFFTVVFSAVVSAARDFSGAHSL
jgi:serine/threonine protein kinase